MTDVEVRLGDVDLGSIYRQPGARGERIAFRYAEQWLSHEERFAIDPELFLDRSTTVAARAPLFGAFADSAPDRWGRKLMQRHERQLAESEGRAVRTLSELDYVLEHCVIHGSVNKVVDRLLALREETGDFGEIVYAGMDWADPALAKRSMELMAEQVMPRVNDAIGKSAAA